MSFSKIRKWNAPLLIHYCALVIALGLFTGCAGNARRVDIGDEPITDVEVNDVDIRAMAVQMASKLIESDIVANAKEPITIAFLEMVNRTETVDFDSYNIMSKIRQHLLDNSKGKLVFLDREKTDAILAERDAKRAGQLTTKGYKDRFGADYFLTGYAYSQRKAGSNGELVASHRYEFHLTDTETSAVVWQWDYEFKKAGKRGIDYR